MTRLALIAAATTAVIIGGTLIATIRILTDTGPDW